jgi:3-hydroxyisobutyrate dehydrogenase-like beta-hydroxyacid dehydrogenase
MKIGVVGLGRMGSQIARRVLGAGHELIVFNRTPDKGAPLREAGAAIATSLRDACAGRDVVITMLADDPALQAVAYAPDGLVASLPAGAIHMAMGTHGVPAIRALTKAHAQAGQTLVACPVLGRPDVAAAGQLFIIAAGPADALERCRPLLEAIGKHVFHAGMEPMGATAVKITNNFVLGCAIMAMGEAFSLVRKFGVDASLMHDVLSNGLLAAPAYKVYGRIISEERWDEVGYVARLGLKDANLALEAAEAVSVPLPSVNAYRDRLLGAIAHGDGDRDWAVMAREQARAAGL